jgi:hypothetical protein
MAVTFISGPPDFSITVSLILIATGLSKVISMLFPSQKRDILSTKKPVLRIGFNHVKRRASQGV